MASISTIYSPYIYMSVEIEATVNKSKVLQMTMPIVS